MVLEEKQIRSWMSSEKARRKKKPQQVAENLLARSVAEERLESMQLPREGAGGSEEGGGAGGGEAGEGYTVEAVVGKKMKKGEAVYLIKWQGYASWENTWEPFENIADFCDLVTAFEDSGEGGSAKETGGGGGAGGGQDEEPEEGGDAGEGQEQEEDMDFDRDDASIASEGDDSRSPDPKPQTLNPKP